MATQLFCNNFAYFLLPIMLLTCAHSITEEVDIEVLRALKDCIDPNSILPLSFLETWNFEMDPCESGGGHFLGVMCTVPKENVPCRVTEIDLDGARYDGFLTQQIGNLTELTVLSLGNNMFRGPIPESVSKLEKLTTLAIQGNYFTGTFPKRFGKLKLLQVLDVSHNRLSGPIPPMISDFRSLTILRLSGNAFTGNIPDLHAVWKLSTLDLSSNMLYGPLPKFPVNLRELVLSHNILTGHVTPIQNQAKLRILDLSDNRFSGAIPHGILSLPKVAFVNVSVNRFTTLEVSKFNGQETQLQTLAARGNRLQGHLPVNLVTVDNLTSIDLGLNRFSGVIPLEYGQKLEMSWQSLYLDGNFLVGNLPPQFTSENQRIRGSISHNCLTCPLTILLCHGGQRTAEECLAQN
uniref:Uncharacterized protein n=1 Tax=Kalanchoe fedtschenkoi TaxID=63787 RepID=A0A7N0UCI6_KALFE